MVKLEITIILYKYEGVYPQFYDGDIYFKLKKLLLDKSIPKHEYYIL